MSSTVWFIVAMCGFSLSALLLIIAILMFIKMNIPAIIGDLSGRTASRQIEEIRARNASGTEKRYKPSAFNLERGKLTDTIDDENNSIHSTVKEEDRSKSSQFVGKSKSGTYALGAESNATNKLANPTDVLSNSTDVLSNPTDVLSNATDVLSNPTDVLSNATDVLSNPTDVLSNATVALSNPTDVLSNATDVLSNPTDVLSDATVALSNPTDVLSNPTDVLSDATAVLSNPTDVHSNPGFKIIKNIVIIHTNEMIS